MGYAYSAMGLAGVLKQVACVRALGVYPSKFLYTKAAVLFAFAAVE